MDNNIQEYVYCASGNTITEPVNGNWLQAYCEYLGVTTPSNDSWLQALCEHFGITQPLYGSWTIALANYYGITAPLNGTWWYAIANDACTGVPAAPCTWGNNTNTFSTETRVWASTADCTTPTPVVNWETAASNWEAEADNWESI